MTSAFPQASARAHVVVGAIIEPVMVLRSESLSFCCEFL